MATESNRLMEVVPLGEDRGDEVAALMGRAFQNDPLFVRACPDPSERARWLPWLFRWSTWKGLLFGQILGTAGQLDGVVATIGPGGGDFSEEQLARSGYGQGREAVGPTVWDRSGAVVNDAFEPADAALHRAVSEPHWYLDVIAVDPAQQGRGIGGTLLRAVSARADADGMPVVLLTYQPANLPLYQVHGYAVVCQGTAPGSGLPWWGMRRDPGN
jgi:ribosomal protein S18 acetylase RimI-like enzyme